MYFARQQQASICNSDPWEESVFCCLAFFWLLGHPNQTQAGQSASELSSPSLTATNITYFAPTGKIRPPPPPQPAQTAIKEARLIQNSKEKKATPPNSPPPTPPQKCSRPCISTEIGPRRETSTFSHRITLLPGALLHFHSECLFLLGASSHIREIELSRGTSLSFQAKRCSRTTTDMLTNASMVQG